MTNLSVYPNWWKLPEIRRRILVTLLLLAFYRLLAHIPLPGLERTLLQQVVQPGSGQATLLGLLNFLSGGALEQISLLALGLAPYLSARELYEAVEKLRPGREDPFEFLHPGRKKERAIRLLTLPMALVQIYGLFYLTSFSCQGGAAVTALERFRTDPLSVVTLAALALAGTFLAVWITDQISLHGIADYGINLVLFSGMATLLPGELLGMLQQTPPRWDALLAYLLLLFAGIYLLVQLGHARRPLTVFLTARSAGPGGRAPHTTLNLPLSLGQEAILAVSTFISWLVLIGVLLACIPLDWLRRGGALLIAMSAEDSVWFGPITFVLVFLLTYFYAGEVLFEDLNLVAQLRQSGAVLAGRALPLASPAGLRYLKKTLEKTLFLPAILSGLLVILPWAVYQVFGVSVSLLSAAAFLLATLTLRDVLTQIEQTAIQESYRRMISRS